MKKEVQENKLEKMLRDLQVLDMSTSGTSDEEVMNHFGLKTKNDLANSIARARVAVRQWERTYPTIQGLLDQAEKMGLETLPRKEKVVAPIKVELKKAAPPVQKQVISPAEVVTRGGDTGGAARSEALLESFKKFKLEFAEMKNDVEEIKRKMSIMAPLSNQDRKLYHETVHKLSIHSSDRALDKELEELDQSEEFI